LFSNLSALLILLFGFLALNLFSHAPLGFLALLLSLLLEPSLLLLDPSFVGNTLLNEPLLLLPS
jgi:hypothetical protein